jgi:hypothetical protein
MCLGISLAFAAGMFMISSVIAGRRVAADLQ